MRPIVKAGLGDADGGPINMMTLLGEKWKELPAAEKLKYRGG